jgi:hypothetical protein
MFMTKLTAVDDTLEKLGTPKMYQKMHILSKWVVIVWIIYCLLGSFYDTIWFIQKKETLSWKLVAAHIVNHCANINTFVQFLFITLLWFV